MNSNLLAALADLLFPRNCAGCGGAVHDDFRYLCWDCVSRLALIQPPFCRRCGDPVEGAAADDFLCAACRENPPAFDLARSAARYRGVLQAVLQEFKYNGATWLSRDLGLFLLACFQAHYAAAPIDAILYVPLFPTKERQRTYNQSLLLAHELGARLRGPPVRHFLEKLRATPTQTHLTAAARRANVRDAFQVREKNAVAGQRFLLIDDVMTTGATVHECARMLKQAGADKVHVLTVARG